MLKDSLAVCWGAIGERHSNEFKLQFLKIAQSIGLRSRQPAELRVTSASDQIGSEGRAWEDQVYKPALVSPPLAWVQRCCWLFTPCLALSPPAARPAPGIPLINRKQLVSQGWLLISSQDESKWRSWAMLCNYRFMHALPEDERSFSASCFKHGLVLIDTSSLWN